MKHLSCQGEVILQPGRKGKELYADLLFTRLYMFNISFVRFLDLYIQIIQKEVLVIILCFNQAPDIWSY